MRAPFRRWLGGMLTGILLAACSAQPADAGRFGFGFRHKTQTIVPQSSPATAAYDMSIGATVDSNGFASLPLRGGAHHYFVANGGSDARSCATAESAATPLATLAAGVACVTAGNGDQVLLAEGSTFTEAMPWLGFKGGFSATYPTVVSSYDPADPTNAAKYGRGDQRSARPVLNPGVALVNGGAVSFIAIKGLDFNPGNIASQALTFSGDGTGTTGGANYVLLENNIFRYSGIVILDGGDGASTTPRSTNIIIRNNSIYGIWSSNGSHVGGIYIEGYDPVTIEDNVIWHTGWKIGGSRDDIDTAGGPTIFNHPIYLQANNGLTTVRRNLMMDNAADGGIARGSTIAWQQNVAIKSPNGFGLGPGNSVDFILHPNGSSLDASYNLSLGAVDLNSTSPRGQAYSLANVSPGGRVHHNLLIYSAVTPGNADNSVATTGAAGYGYPSNQTYTEFEFNVANHWSASGFAFVETNTPIHSAYSDNVWDNPASGTNTNSGSASFPNAYTEAALYTAASVTDYSTLVTLATGHPEAHYQRALLSTAFAGYGMATSATDTTPPSLSSPTGTATGTGTATIGVTTNDATGRLYYELLPTGTAPHPTQVKMGLDASAAAGVSAGSLSISSSGAKTINLTSLAGATYYAHFTHEDSAGNKSTVAVSSAFTVTGASFATWNPADMSGSGIVLSGGNLIATTSGGSPVGVRGTKAIAAKAYWEVHVDTFADGWAAGIADTSASLGGSFWGNGGNSHVYAPFAGGNGQTIMFAVDPVAKLVWRGVNGTWTGDPVAGTGGTSFAAFSGSAYPAFQGDSGDKATANFGASAYTYTPPTGFASMWLMPLFGWRRRRRSAVNDNCENIVASCAA